MMITGDGALTQRGITVPDDNVSLGELGRRLEAMRVDIKDDIHDLANRLDAKVSLERYQLEREAHAREVREVTSRVERLEQARQDDAKQRANERRWLLAGLVFPIVTAVVGVVAMVVASLMGVL